MKANLIQLKVEIFKNIIYVIRKLNYKNQFHNAKNILGSPCIKVITETKFTFIKNNITLIS